jgi:hypothetical protein
VPGIRPGRQGHGSPVWQPSRARGTAADTRGAYMRELREMTPRPRREEHGFASRAEESRRIFVDHNPGKVR